MRRHLLNLFGGIIELLIGICDIGYIILQFNNTVNSMGSLIFLNLYIIDPLIILCGIKDLLDYINYEQNDRLS